MSCEDTLMPWGKHKNETLGDIVADDPTYLDWLRGLGIRSPVLKRAVDEMCEKYAAEIERAIGD